MVLLLYMLIFVAIFAIGAWCFGQFSARTASGQAQAVTAPGWTNPLGIIGLIALVAIVVVLIVGTPFPTK